MFDLVIQVVLRTSKWWLSPIRTSKKTSTEKRCKTKALTVYLWTPDFMILKFRGWDTPVVESDRRPYCVCESSNPTYYSEGGPPLRYLFRGTWVIQSDVNSLNSLRPGDRVCYKHIKRPKTGSLIAFRYKTPIFLSVTLKTRPVNFLWDSRCFTLITKHDFILRIKSKRMSLIMLVSF